MLVIWNPNAGSVAAAQAIKQRMEARDRTAVHQTTTGDQAIRLVAQHLAQGENQIVAAGGDGTINAVINGMMQHPSDATLGVLPLGTANDWCASLQIPDDLSDALALVDAQQARQLDVVKVETPSAIRYFANIATGGNSHRVTESVTSEMKQMWGALCYLRGAIGVVADLDTFRAAISFDQSPPETFDVWNIIVANGKTSAGRLAIAPQAELDDGLLDIVIIRDGTLLDLANLTVQVMITSTYLESDQVEYRQAREISINSNPPLLFSIDGDMIDEQPVRFSACPGAIRVVTGY